MILMHLSPLYPDLEASIIAWIKEKAPANTTKTYKTYADQFLRWCERKELNPQKAVSMCDFLRNGLEERGLARGTLADVIPAAAEDYFRFSDSSPARDCPAMIAAMKKVLRAHTRKPQARKPMLRKHLIAMAAAATPTLKETRDILLMVLMFAGFLRESEAVALEEADVWITQAEASSTTVLYMVVRKSKTDQYSENATVVVSGCPGNPICPVMWYKRYMALRRDSPFFFHQAPKNSVEKLAKSSPCYLVKYWLARISVDPKGFGSHSLRRGGATAAAQAHIKMHVLKRHGRWRSDAVYMYIVDGPEQQLGVSQAVLGGLM